MKQQYVMPVGVDDFRQVREHLTPDGVMVVNMNMHEEDPDGINAQLSDTIAAVFDEVVVVDVPGSTNRELFAGAKLTDVSLTDAGALGATPQAEKELLSWRLSEVEGRLKSYERGGHLLTDDKAPVELLGMRVIDSLIREEIGLYKDAFRRQGLQGLLEVM